MTKVISLFGGSGLGKSTTAALLFGTMKQKGFHCEQVTEYVKKWAWQGRKPSGFDQIYLAGKQANAESQLYGKVDYIITDSPILLSGFYEEYHLKRNIVLPAIINFLDFSKENGVEHVNFFLSRNKKFDPRGRYETEEEARRVDDLLRNWLTNLGQPIIEVPVPDSERVEYILQRI